MEVLDALEAEKLTHKSVNSIAGHPVIIKLEAKPSSTGTGLANWN